MGVRPPCPDIFNIAGTCECSSILSINRPDTRVFLNGEKRGTVFLSGSICPSCNNLGSNFLLTFVDNDLTDGNQSFTFKPLAINPSSCIIDNGNLVQFLSGVGIFTPTNGTPSADSFQLVLSESTTLGANDSFSFILGPNILIPDTTIPDNSLIVTQCNTDT